MLCTNFISLEYSGITLQSSQKKKGSGHYTKCTNNLAYNPYVKEWSDFRRWEKYLLQSAHPIYATTAPDIEIPS